MEPLTCCFAAVLVLLLVGARFSTLPQHTSTPSTVTLVRFAAPTTRKPSGPLPSANAAVLTVSATLPLVAAAEDNSTPPFQSAEPRTSKPTTPMPPPPLHTLLKINDFLSPPQDCSKQSHCWDAVIPRCDVATLQLCNASDGEVKFCEFNETTPIAVEDVLFMTVERYPRVSFTVAVARDKDGKTRIIDRSHDFFAYRYYSYFPPHIMKDSYGSAARGLPEVARRNVGSRNQHQCLFGI